MYIHIYMLYVHVHVSVDRELSVDGCVGCGWTYPTGGYVRVSIHAPTERTEEGLSLGILHQHYDLLQGRRKEMVTPGGRRGKRW